MNKASRLRILFLYTSLSHLSEAGVFNDLIKEFAKQGHFVKVAVPANKGDKIGLNIESGIGVLRFQTDKLTRNSSNIQKGIAYIKFIYQCIFAIRKHFAKETFDLIIAHSLPPEMGVIVPYLKKKFKAKFYLMLCEYVWQDAISLGFFSKKNPICLYYKILEKKLIHSADYIGSPSKGNIDFALKYYSEVCKHKIGLLYYSHSPIKTIDQKSDIRRKYNLVGKFVAIYGGNMTIAQKIENVISLAESCLDHPEIIFILIGKGPYIDIIKKNITDRRINNILFINYLPKDEYNSLLSACDVGLVSLNERLGTPNIPSKTLSYFNLSKPVVASIDYVTDYGDFLEMTGGGLWSYAGDTAKFKENLLKLYYSPELSRQIGENGSNFYFKNMLPEKAYEIIINQLNTNCII